jgi:hypothetical protein
MSTALRRGVDDSGIAPGGKPHGRDRALSREEIEKPLIIQPERSTARQILLKNYLRRLFTPTPLSMDEVSL